RATSSFTRPRLGTLTGRTLPTMKRTSRKANISRNITTHFSPLQGKSNPPRRRRNASRIRTLPRPRTSRHVTIPHRAIPPVVLTTARARILAAAVTVAGIAAAVAVGDAVADATVADARSRVVRAGATCLPRNMHRRKEANPADMKIAADSRAVTTSGVWKLREAQGPR